MREEKAHVIVEGDTRIHFLAKSGTAGTKEHQYFGSFNGIIEGNKKFRKFTNVDYIKLIEKHGAFDLRHIGECGYKGDMFTIKIPHDEHYNTETAILFGTLE